MRSLIPVVTSAESAARDAAAIAAGIPSRALMGRAGAAAAAEIARRFPDRMSRGVLVLAGPGNNGGDGWVIARALAATGIEVRVLAPEGARSPDCMAERALALPAVHEEPWVRERANVSGEDLVIDALLGTGATGEPRGELQPAQAMLREHGRRGATIVAIDLPSGVDATTGATHGAAGADLTITFGTIKRGHLVARGICGVIVAVDIGLTSGDSTLDLIDARWVSQHVPPIAVDAHKGTRKKLLVHGGSPGMAGAVILGVRAALRSGIGMVKARVHPATVDAVHGAVPATLVDSWPAVDDLTTEDWADVLVIGPGLGRGDQSRRAVESAARRHKGPMLLDADALAVFDGDRSGLRAVIAGRPALITPHVMELSRLTGYSPAAIDEGRFEVAAEFARDVGATVLLKGVPTVIGNPDGRRFVVAAGTPTLATGGSGDLLAGIAGTLLAQIGDPFIAAACAAWIHGRASELAGAHVRGTTLDEVLEMLPNAWSIDARPPQYPMLTELRAVPSQ